MLPLLLKFILNHPKARAVANNENVEVKVLNPTLETNKPKELDKKKEVIDYESVMQEEAELETWGFAKPEGFEEVQPDPREKIEISYIQSTRIFSLKSSESDEWIFETNSRNNLRENSFYLLVQ